VPPLAVVTRYVLLPTFYLCRLLPCGVIAPSHEGPPLGTAVLPLDDKLFSASQRYTYFQEKPLPIAPLQQKRNVRPPARFKNARMTVRLRPRQVLCSKCRGICNENSENVDISAKKRKHNEVPDNSNHVPIKSKRKLRSASNSNLETSDNESRTNSIEEVPLSKRIRKGPTQDDKLVSPAGDEVDSPVNGKVGKAKLHGKWRDGSADRGCVSEEEQVSEVEEDPLSLPSSQHGNQEHQSFSAVTEDPLDISQPQPLRLLRKKRSVGSMEDLWDEHVLEEGAKSANDKRSRTPVIKITFGSATGEGTVVEIPRKIQDNPSESETEDKRREKTKRDASAKAAKKALKKAKKEARRKIVEGASPATSPRYPNLSPRYLTSPRHPPTPVPQVFHKKHKHKVKHKKKHK